MRFQLTRSGRLRAKHAAPNGASRRDCFGEIPGLAGRAASRPNKEAGFTLAEVLAALVFMAIVIPVAVQALKIANTAGQVAVRKAEATRVADRLLSESIVTTNWNKPGLSGSVQEGAHQFRWLLRNETWQDPIRVLSVQVTFAVQGQDYDVRLSTLVDNSQ